MINKRILLLIVLIFLLAGCSALSELAKSQLAAEKGKNGSAATETPAPLQPSALSGDLSAQQLMLDSSNRWKTLQASYTVSDYSPGGANAQPEITVHEIWIELPALFKVVIKSPMEGPIVTRISNGQFVLDQSGVKQDIPPAALQPFIPPAEPSNAIYTHPLAELLGTPVETLIFPVALATRQGAFTPSGEETIAGRTTLVTDWGPQPGALSERLWVDKKTGVVLRQQIYDKGGTETPVKELQATYISFDSEIDPATFGLGQVPTPTPTKAPPTPVDTTARVTILPQNLNIRSGPNTGYEIIATLDTGAVLKLIGRTANNEWYKVEFDGKTGWLLALYVEVSGDVDKVPVINY